jgi:hypothetical protein
VGSTRRCAHASNSTSLRLCCASSWVGLKGDGVLPTLASTSCPECVKNARGRKLPVRFHTGVVSTASVILMNSSLRSIVTRAQLGQAALCVKNCLKVSTRREVPADEPVWLGRWGRPSPGQCEWGKNGANRMPIYAIQCHLCNRMLMGIRASNYGPILQNPPHTPTQWGL